MPELPDVEIYVAALRERIAGARLGSAVIRSPFTLHTVVPPLSKFVGLKVETVHRMGKRIVIGFEHELFMVIHLMIAGRLLWEQDASGKVLLAAFEFDGHKLTLTEAAPKKRASIHLVEGRKNLDALDSGGLDILHSSKKQFEDAIRKENRTLKRALTSPQLFSGIGNAYSDEILHAARLSPVRLTRSLSPKEVSALQRAAVRTLKNAIATLRAKFGGRFPGRGDITAFREEHAVHGKFGRPCPVCGAPIQRIRYAENETNYCAKCQNEGRLLADRALSRLLKSDWPRTLEEMTSEQPKEG